MDQNGTIYFKDLTLSMEYWVRIINSQLNNKIKWYLIEIKQQ